MDIPLLKNLHLMLVLRGAVNVGLCGILFDWSGGLAAVRHLHHGSLNLGSLLWAKTDRQAPLTHCNSIEEGNIALHLNPTLQICDVDRVLHQSLKGLTDIH